MADPHDGVSGKRKWRRTDITLTDASTKARVVVKLWNQDFSRDAVSKTVTFKNVITAKYKDEIVLNSLDDTAVQVWIAFLFVVLVHM